MFTGAWYTGVVIYQIHPVFEYAYIVMIHPNFPIKFLRYTVVGFLLTITMSPHVFVISFISHKHAGIFITDVLK